MACFFLILPNSLSPILSIIQFFQNLEIYKSDSRKKRIDASTEQITA